MSGEVPDSVEVDVTEALRVAAQAKSLANALELADAVGRVCDAVVASGRAAELSDDLVRAWALCEWLRGGAKRDELAGAPGARRALADGERPITYLLTAEGVGALGEVVEAHPLPWSIDGRELVDARGALVFAASLGVERRAARDLLLSVLVAAVAAAGSTP